VGSSLVGYDVGQYVRETHPVGRTKPGRKAEPPSKRRISWPRWTGFRNKTVWDLLQLLIVPLMLAAVGLWFSAQQDARQLQIEDQRAQVERELEEQRAQDEALQAYLDQMSTLLLEEDLRNSEQESEVRTLARARTLTVLGRLDPSRKTEVMQFLVEAKLIQSVDERAPIIGLGSADLSDTDLYNADLFGAHLRDADLSNADLTLADLFNADLYNAELSAAVLFDADLSNADLSRADLSGADGRSCSLVNADLSGAKLRGVALGGANPLEGAGLVNADLSYADVRDANLSYVVLRDANLSSTHLSDTDLSHADLSGADLRGADLRGANLSDVNGKTAEELEDARSLEGATMPDGQKYEDWLKSRGEDGENSGPS
jgi:uncharacterized protein YjbI with pentapeptide repeats